MYASHTTHCISHNSQAHILCTTTDKRTYSASLPQSCCHALARTHSPSCSHPLHRSFAFSHAHTHTTRTHSHTLPHTQLGSGEGWRGRRTSARSTSPRSTTPMSTHALSLSLSFSFTHTCTHLERPAAGGGGGGPPIPPRGGGGGGGGGTPPMNPGGGGGGGGGGGRGGAVHPVTHARSCASEHI